jgi:hypothetical protein
MPDRQPLSELFSNITAFEKLSSNDVLCEPLLTSLNFRKHPLGFAHAGIAKEGPYALRLHVWPDFTRYQQQPYWPIHNHKFDLISRVLTGALTNRLYRVRQSSKPGYSRLYDISYEGHGSVIMATDECVSVELEASHEIIAPNLYRVNAGCFHETFVPTGIFTATLAITRDSAHELAIKTVGDSKSARHEYFRSLIAQAEHDAIVARINQILQTVSG